MSFKLRIYSVSGKRSRSIHQIANDVPEVFGPPVKLSESWYRFAISVVYGCLVPDSRVRQISLLDLPWLMVASVLVLRNNVAVVWDHVTRILPGTACADCF